MFSVLQDHGVIKPTEYWTATNVASGLAAICVTLEMVLVAAFQAWAFPWQEYRVSRIGEDEVRNTPNSKGRTNPFWALLYSLNFADFFIELWLSLRFVFDRLRGKEYTRQDARLGAFDFLIFQGGDGKVHLDKGGDQQVEMAQVQSNASHQPLRAAPAFERPSQQSQTTLLAHQNRSSTDPSVSQPSSKDSPMPSTGGDRLSAIYPDPKEDRPRSWEPQAM